MARALTSEQDHLRRVKSWALAAVQAASKATSRSVASSPERTLDHFRYRTSAPMCQ